MLFSENIGEDTDQGAIKLLYPIQLLISSQISLSTFHHARDSNQVNGRDKIVTSWWRFSLFSYPSTELWRLHDRRCQLEACHSRGTEQTACKLTEYVV